MSLERYLPDREALDQFKEDHPELSSARRIVTLLDEETFVARYAAEFDDGRRQARRVYQTARDVNERMALAWANIADLSSPHLWQTRFNNVPQSFLDHLQQIPGYDRLFGGLDFIECDHCRSIFGPAAYFVDLLRFVETYIVGDRGNTIANEMALDYRRPDLKHITLDCHNAHDLIPYIDLVNELLEGLIRYQEGRDAYEILAGAVFPPALPFNRPLAEIRAYLKQLKTSLGEIYERFDRSPEAPSSDISREILALSPATFSLLAEEQARPADLSALYGLDVTLSGLDGLENLAVFRAQTGLDREQVNELLYQDLDQHEENAGLARLFFINDVDDGLGPVTLVEAKTDSGETYEKLTGLSFAKLDRIYRFLKLARHLDWSYTDLDWALRSLRPAYRPETALHFDGQNDYVAIGGLGDTAPSQFTIEAWVSPEWRQPSPIIARGAGGDAPAGFMLAINEAGNLVFQSHDQTYSGRRALPLDHFSHVAVAYDGAEIRLYVNGQLDSAEPAPQPLTNSGDQLNIGRDLVDRYFMGVIKEARFWDAARSPEQIAANRYRRLSGREKHLLAYWPLVENRWNRLEDRGPGGHHGLIGGQESVTQPVWVQRDLVLHPFPERIAGGYAFDGQDDYLAARDVSGLDNNSFTVEAWVTAESWKSTMLLIKGDASQDQTHFYLGLNRSGHFVFKSDGVAALASSGTYTAGEPTHICLVVSPEQVLFYINGELDSRHTPRSLSVMDAPDKPARDLIVGRHFDGNHFEGLLQELRIWAGERDQDQIQMNMFRRAAAAEPGLAGYWPLTAAEPDAGGDVQVARDQTANQNHLYLGGMPEDYRPDRLQVPRIKPLMPVATAGQVLQFDGDNDLVAITNPKQAGLGAYERWTAAFWFRADEPQLPWEQLLFVQGDGEAGLSVFLRDGQVHVAAWNANFELTEVKEARFSAAPVQAGQWHHLAISCDESPDLDRFDMRLILDGRRVDGGQGYRLSSVGPITLGGLARGAITHLDQGYTKDGEQHRYFFAGQIAHFQLWQTAVDADVIELERWLAPERPAEKLLAYLPMDEGQGRRVFDRDASPDHHGQLLIDELALATSAVAAEGEQLFCHYNEPAALDWSDYYFSGRLFIEDADQAIGVAVMSRHHENVDQCYLLRRTPAEPTFALVAHPVGIQEVSGALDSGIAPQPNTWVRFLIRVEVSAEQTAIAAKIWPDEGAEPADFQIQAVDDSHIHIQAGTVAVWSAAGGARWADDLRVWPAAIEAPDRTMLLLRENFEAYSPGADPEGWLDSRVRGVIEEDDSLFRTGEVDGEICLSIDGDHSPLEDLHCHYTLAEALAWNKYVYRGRLRLSGADQAIGLTFFSRFPDQDAYYRLRRTQDKPAFHLDAHPYQAHDLDGQLETTLSPEPERWYHFYIEVEDGQELTAIRARLWPQGEDEPAAFMIDAHDGGQNRLRSGTVGLWTLGPGAKHFADLQVAESRLLAENFATYTAGQRPEPWSATRMIPAHQLGKDIFRVTAVEQDIAYGLDGRPLELASLFTFYAGERAQDWRDYAYSGRFYLADADAAMGLTFLGQTDGHGLRHYRLGRTARLPRLRLTNEPSGYPALTISVDEGLAPEAQTWYHFRIEVRDLADEGQTDIGVKIWAQGQAEPAGFQIQAHDAAEDRLATGTVGLWGIGGGAGGNAFTVDDLSVTQLDGPVTLFSDTFSRRKSTWTDAHFVPEGVPPEVQVERYKRTTFRAGGGQFLSDSVIQPWGAVKRFDPEMTHYHAAFHDDDVALAWTNYALRGRIQYSEKDSGIGFIFFSRRPAGQVQEYRLTRDEPHARFGLTSTGRQPTGRTHSDFEPLEDTWYSFLIEARDTGNRTHIRAKIWNAAIESEPRTFQIDAQDTGRGRLRGGTIGLWTNGPGAKLFADLQVERLALLNDDFDHYPAGSTPENWLQARVRPLLPEANDSLLVVSPGGNQALQLPGTGGAAEQVLAHVTDPASLAWTNYEYSGRLRLLDDQAGIGLTFFSRYAEGQDHTYSLRRDQQRPNWHLTGHPFEARLLSGRVELDESPVAGTWYRFRISAIDRGQQTEIQAKVWPDGDPEPAEYQLTAQDDSPDRLTAGGVGLWTAGEGQVLFDDLQLYHDVRLAEVFAAYGAAVSGAGADPDNWLDTRSHSLHTVDDSLFKIGDAQNNLARWRESATYPVLKRPLDGRGLAFDGRRQYLAAEMKGLDELERFTLELWLRLDGDGASRQPVWHLSGREGRPFDLALAIEPGEKINLLSGGQSFGLSDDSSAAFLTEGWNHLCLDVGPSAIDGFINGKKVLNVGWVDRGLFHIRDLEIGRLEDDHLHGQVRDIRLWRGSRAEHLADDILYQLPLASADLLGYWPLAGDAGPLALDEAGDNHLRLGGLAGARQPSITPEREPAGHWPYPALDTSLSFAGRDGGLHLAWQEQDADEPLQRRTIELWFSVDDKDLDRRQILYHEGDDRRGLVIYIHNGRLLFGGYNDPAAAGPSGTSPAGETTWPGSWLQSGRFESGKWHRATLVLDGRRELRPGSLRAYLDGRLVGLDDGCRLGRAPLAFSLGGTNRPVRFAGGLAAPDERPPFFAGQILDVRLWSTARTQAEIWASHARQLTGGEPRLALWLQAEEGSLRRAAGAGLADRLDELLARLSPLAEFPEHRLPGSALTGDSLVQIAHIKRLKERHRLSMDRLCALWYEVKHRGRADRRTLFDQAFNPDGVVQERWPVYMNAPLRWDVSGRREPGQVDKAIRSRLMAALRLSHDDLNSLVAWLHGPGTLVTLDKTMVNDLYRLAHLAGVLRQSAPDLLKLLGMMGIGRAGLSDLQNFIALEKRAAWMKRSGLNVDELDLLLYDRPGKRARIALDEAALDNLAAAIDRQAADFLVTPNSLESDEVDRALAAELFDFLTGNGFVDLLDGRPDAGLVTAKYPHVDFERLAAGPGWASRLREALGAAVLHELRYQQKDGVVEQRPGMDLSAEQAGLLQAALGEALAGALAALGLLNPHGYLALGEQTGPTAGQKVALLDGLKSAGPGVAPLFAEMDALPLPMATAIWDVLSRWRDSQDSLGQLLLDRQAGQDGSLLDGLADLTGADADILQVVIDHFAAGAPARQVLEWLLALAAGDSGQKEALRAYLYKVSKILYLAGQLGLTAQEMGILLARPASFGVSQVLYPTIKDLENLHAYTELRQAMDDGQGGLLAVIGLDGADEAALQAALIDLTGWERGQLRALLDHFAIGPAYNRPQNLSRLQGCFALAQSMGVDIPFLVQLATHAGQAAPDYTFYREQAALLFGALRARYTEERWPKIQRPIHDELAVQQRDALLSLVMLDVAGKVQGQPRADILSEYFLIDVQTGSEVDTSRLVQAIAALQLYVQRCQMNLEEGINPATIPAEEWEWVKNYRVWEANRKVFLYPENYIEPELRDTKSPFFEELEQELMQGDVTQAAVEQAYINYLDKFARVGQLKIVGSYLATDDIDKPLAEREETLYLVGQTRDEPRVHYYRERRRSDGALSWKPWKKIELSINGDFVTPVYAFNKLFLFWVELTKGTKSVEIKTGEDETKHESVDIYKPVIKYSYFNFNRQWVQPLTMPVKGQNGKELELDEPTAALDSWQRVVVQRAIKNKVQAATPPSEWERNARVLKLEGTTSLNKQLPNLNTGGLTWSFWARFSEPNPAQARRQFPEQTLTLFEYGRRFRVTATTVVTEIPGAWQAELEAFDAYLEARDAHDQAHSVLLAAMEALEKDPDNKDKQKAVTDAREARRVTSRAHRAAREKWEEARDAPKWQTLSVKVRFQIDQNDMVTVDLAYDAWHHLALTMRHRSGTYFPTLFLNGAQVASASITAGPLPRTDQLAIGPATDDAFTIQMSEFRLWAYVRDQAQISGERDERKLGTEFGLSYLPLNALEPGATMTLADSTLAFRTPAPAPIPVVAEERLVIFYGNIAASVRNDLQEQSFDLRLRTDYKKLNYDVTLTMTNLHMVQRKGLSINDYVESSLLTGTPYGETTTINLRGLSPSQIRNYIQQWQAADNVIAARNRIWQTFRQVFGWQLPDEPLQYTDMIRAAQNYLNELYKKFNVDNYLFRELPAFESTIMDVGNQPGWYIVDTGNEQFLMTANLADIQTAGERMLLKAGKRTDEFKPQPVDVYFTAEKRTALEGGQDANPPFTFKLERLSTYAVYELSRELFKNGLESMLSPDSQGAAEWDFGLYKYNSRLLQRPAAATIDFDGAHGLYYREIFFHIPFYVANLLNANQRFDEAQNWYHTVFDPMSAAGGSGADRYWRYLPFRKPFAAGAREGLWNILVGDKSDQSEQDRLDKALNAYRQDPFDPHAIAELRLFAYQKAIVMKYIDNLLDWGDQLFSQDTRESVNEAISYYLLAYNLLGPRPEGKVVKDFREIGDYAAVRAAHDPLPDFLVELENSLAGSAASGASTPTPHSHIATEFCAGENTHFTGYWDRVEDRLYKIRHSLNIEGIFRQLALFEPPLDPAALVRAVAGGLGISGALTSGSGAVPHYRYSFMLERAQEMTGRVIELGGALLSALESKDAEALALLLNTQEQDIMTRAAEILKLERDGAEEAIKALQVTKRSIEKRKERYAKLIDENLSPEEILELVFLTASFVANNVAVGFDTAAAAARGVPTFVGGGAGISSPVVLTQTGGQDIAETLETVAVFAKDLVRAFDFSAQMTDKANTYKRRKAEWEFEKSVAEFELEEIEHQITQAEIARKIADKQIAIQTRELEHNRQVADFYRSKFSNQALYSWMISQLSSLYFQSYKLAYDVAKAAEKAVQYELPTNETFIGFGHWDSLRKGLLAGESLMLDLGRMQKSQLEQDSRFLEIEKTISMRRTFPGALLLLAATGECEFELGEALFDLDFPGHYCRLIKTISISVQADVDPIDGVKATLVQLSNKTLLEPNIDAVQFLLGNESAGELDTSIIRANWRANQQIAISRQNEDIGMFALDFFFDDRYFPFEGTGAVSHWRLEMPRETNSFDFDLAKDDVIIHLRYTAKTASGPFKKEVLDALGNLPDQE